MDPPPLETGARPIETGPSPPGGLHLTASTRCSSRWTWWSPSRRRARSRSGGWGSSPCSWPRGATPRPDLRRGRVA